jgi:hypothetical protein
MKLWDKDKTLGANLKDMGAIVVLLAVVWGGGIAVLRGMYHEEVSVWDRVVEDYTLDDNGKTALERVEIRLTMDSVLVMEVMAEKDAAAKKKRVVNCLRIDENGRLWYVDVDLQEYPAYKVDAYSDQWFTQYAYIDKRGNEHWAN